MKRAKFLTERGLWEVMVPGESQSYCQLIREFNTQQTPSDGIFDMFDNDVIEMGMKALNQLKNKLEQLL